MQENTEVRKKKKTKQHDLEKVSYDCLHKFIFPCKL